MKKYRIAIDGPASAGKSTAAKAVAKRLGYVYLDTGAMYRAVTLLAQRAGVTLSDEQAVSDLLPQCEITFVADGEQQRVYLNGEDVTATIRMPEVTASVSEVSAIPSVRTFLVDCQRTYIQDGGIVMDGRDIGTVVMPDAEVKIFLVASVETRAQRRFLENAERGIHTPLAVLQQEIADRDHYDANRATSPLTQATDAVVIDTSDLTLDEVVAKICAYHDALSVEML